MTKISVSLPEEMIDFIDKQGKNRSRTIVTILEDYKAKKMQDELEKEYEEYAKFCEEDDKDFWQDWETAAVDDFNRGSENE
jgi:metal-responsive CopG/Arc/MetJ family transcriptional regulator